MKLKIMNTDKTETGSVTLPAQFDEPVRPDLIKKAVLSHHSRERQAYGAFAEAGKRPSAIVSKRRRDYRGSYGIGISRVPRKVLSRRGTRMNWVGAFAPGTVKGRRAHPPKPDKQWEQKINKKEKRKAIRSALSATMIVAHVKARGHLPPLHYPFIIDDHIETITKTKDAYQALTRLGFSEELIRSQKTRIRAGKGKMRGRKTITPIGLLIVVSKDCPLMKAGRGIAGITIERIDALNAKILAPGTHPGRITLYTTSALDRLKNENLYFDNAARSTEKTTEAKPVKETKKTERKPEEAIKATPKTTTKKTAKTTTKKPKT
ncbi:MAG: 50S ribosomal protein L4 [Nanoarchaeota archaeon]